MGLQKNAGAAKRFDRLMRFSAWLMALPNRLMPPAARLVQLGSAFWQSRALYVAARLDVATALGDQPCSVDALAEAVGAHPDRLYRLLRLLAAAGVFEESAPRVFRNNPVSTELRSDRPGNVRAIVLMHNSDVMSRPWYEQLEAGVRSGDVPFALSHGLDLFAYMDAHPDFDALFAEAMDGVEALTGDSFATDFDWGRFERVIDVGGSRGAKALAILKRHPRLTALIVDRPQVIEGAEQYWSSRVSPDLLGRLGFQAGDILQSVPAAAGAGDIYFLSAVLHGMSDDQALTVLRALAAGCGSSGARVALLELVVPDVRADLTSAAFDLQMLMATHGRERTLAQWRELVEGAGLALDEVVSLQSFGKILVLDVAG